MSFILDVLAVGHTIRTENLWLPDLLFEVAGSGFYEAPHCVAPKSPESSQRSAMTEPPTTTWTAYDFDGMR